MTLGLRDTSQQDAENNRGGVLTCSPCGEDPVAELLGGRAQSSWLLFASWHRMDKGGVATHPASPEWQTLKSTCVDTKHVTRVPLKSDKTDDVFKMCSCTVKSIEIHTLSPPGQLGKEFYAALLCVFCVNSAGHFRPTPPAWGFQIHSRTWRNSHFPLRILHRVWGLSHSGTSAADYKSLSLLAETGNSRTRQI